MKKLLFVLVALLSFSSQAQATTFYVKKTGNDAVSCVTAQTVGTPKLTIASAISCLTASNADIIDVGVGTYAEGFTTTQLSTKSGTSYANAATIQAHTGETVTLAPSAGTACFNFANFGPNFRYFIFKDLFCDGANNNATSSDASAASIGGGSNGGFIDHIKFDNVVIHHWSGGCYQTIGGTDNSGSFIWITGGSCHDIATSTVASSDRHAWYLEGGDNLVEYSECYNVGRGYCAHVYGSSNSTRNIVRYSYMHNVGTDVSQARFCIGFYSGNSNQAYGNICAASQNGADIASSLNLLYNNTFYANGVGFVGAGCCYDAIKNNGGSTNVIKNNLLNANQINSIDTSGSSGTVSSNNLTTGTTASHFVSAAGGNFSLVSGSTAINAGTASIASGVTACKNNTNPAIGAVQDLGSPTATVNGTAMVVTVPNNCAAQMLPATGVTGFTAKKNGSGDTVNANVRTGSNSFAITLNSAFVGGDTCLFSYSQTGNATSDNNIGGLTTSNQEILAFTDTSCTNITAGTGSVGLSHWRVYLLQGATDTAWVAKCAEDSSNCIVAPGSKLWIRYKVRNSSGSNYPAFNVIDRWRYNGGSYVTLTSANYVNSIKVVGNSAQLGTVISDGTTLTADQLTSNGTNVACLANRSTNSIPSLTLNDGTEAECARAVDISTAATLGDTYEGCPYDDVGTALTCATPIKLTIGSYASAR